MRRSIRCSVPGRAYSVGVGHRDEVREFLTSRRSRITPEQAGLEAGQGRRVPGLRRREVAMLANVSVEYYSRLERGELAGASETVLDAIARALAMDEAERVYLFDLARLVNRSPSARSRQSPTAPWVIRPATQRLLDAIDSPALIRNGCLDLVAANRAGRAFYTDAFAQTERPANLARFVFLDRERSDRFLPDWETAARISVAIMRVETSLHAEDQRLLDLIGELSAGSEEFRTLWAGHDVRIHGRGEKQVRHPVVGDLEVAYEELELTAEPGLILLVYTAAPGSASAERLRNLAVSGVHAP